MVMADIKIPSKNAPEHKIRAGQVRVAVWRNSTQDGKTFYSCTLEKQFKKDNEWKTTNSLNKNDVPKAVLALQKAYEYLVLNKTQKEIIEEEMPEVNEEEEI